jgi:MFS family permease
MGVAAIVAQTPIGALVDRTSAKRALVVAGAITVTVGTLAMPLFPRFAAISLLQALTGAAGSVFAPALAAITLGVVGSRAFSRVPRASPERGRRTASKCYPRVAFDS